MGKEIIKGEDKRRSLRIHQRKDRVESELESMVVEYRDLQFTLPKCAIFL